MGPSDEDLIAKAILPLINSVAERLGVHLKLLEIYRENILPGYSMERLDEEFTRVLDFDDIVVGSYLQCEVSAAIKRSEDEYIIDVSGRIHVDAKKNLTVKDLKIHMFQLRRGDQWTDKLKNFLTRWGGTIIEAIARLIEEYLKRR